jgi:hypothetical protein
MTLRRFLVKRKKGGVSHFLVPKHLNGKTLASLRRVKPQLKGTKLIRAKSGKDAVAKFIRYKPGFKK